MLVDAGSNLGLPLLQLTRFFVVFVLRNPPHEGDLDLPSHRQSACGKWKVPSDISELRSRMRLPSLSKSKSEVFGQRGHCSARLLAALCANNGLMHRSKERLYSITSSARARSVAGTSIPSALAVLRLITSSNLVGRWIGSSPGFAPARIRATYAAACVKIDEKFGP